MILLRVMRSAAAGLVVAALAVVSVQAEPLEVAQAKSAPKTQQGEAPDALRLAVIDLEEINRKAAVFKNIRSQMEQYSTTFSQAIKAEDDELRNANKELARQRTILSPEAYAEERRKFEKSVTDFQRQVERRKQSLNAVHSKAIVEAENALKKVIAEFAREQGIALVLRSDTIVFWTKAMDMTEIVLERLDKALPSVKVAQPEK